METPNSHPKCDQPLPREHIEEASLRNAGACHSPYHDRHNSRDTLRAAGAIGKTESMALLKRLWRSLKGELKLQGFNFAASARPRKAAVLLKDPSSVANGPSGSCNPRGRNGGFGGRPMTRSSVLAVLLVLCPFYSLAQESDDPDDLFTSSTLSGLSFRSIGPALTSGHVSDIAVHPDNHASQSGTGAHSLRIRVSTP